MQTRRPLTFRYPPTHRHDLSLRVTCSHKPPSVCSPQRRFAAQPARGPQVRQAAAPHGQPGLAPQSRSQPTHRVVLLPGPPATALQTPSARSGPGSGPGQPSRAQLTCRRTTLRVASSAVPHDTQDVHSSRKWADEAPAIAPTSASSQQSGCRLKSCLVPNSFFLT